MQTLIKTELTLVDELGLLQAEIANLEAKADLIKNQLKNDYEGEIVGNLYRGFVTLSQRTTVDSKGVFAEANVPADLIAKYSKTTAVITLKVSAR